MKRIAFQFANPASRAIAATAFLAAIACASPAQAAAADPVGAPASTAAETPATMDKESAERVEGQIKHLHEKLEITAAQEDKWKDVARVMRDNASKLTALVKARSENAKTMTAVDDLKSYAAITEAHETGVEKLLPVFTALYDSLSDAQKKAADEEFRHRHGDGHEHHHHGH